MKEDSTVKVIDQFGDPIGDLYAGAVITEYNGLEAINQKLRADSTYLDPVGKAQPSAVVQQFEDVYIDLNDNGRWDPDDFMIDDWNGNGVYDGIDPRIATWPAAPPLPMTASSETQNIPIEVDDFSLNPAVVNRKWTATPPSTIKVTWP